MTRGYEIKRGNISMFHKEISVHNFPLLNVCFEEPIVKRTNLIFTKHLVGFWKIKNLKL